MPNYQIEGKILTPMTDEEFEEGIKKGKFLAYSHIAYCVGLYYTAVRKTELQRAMREQFQITEDAMFFEVGQRLKHSEKTPALKLPLVAPFMNILEHHLKTIEKGKRVFPFCPKTAYNIVRRAFKYPHFFRLSRITNFFLEGWTIAQVHSWTGLSLSALNFYLGMVDVAKMGESLAKKAQT